MSALTFSSLILTLSSSSTTSRELLSQFSTCCGWRWFEVSEKGEKCHLLVSQFHENSHYKTPSCRESKSVSGKLWCFNASRGLKGLNNINYKERVLGGPGGYPINIINIPGGYPINSLNINNKIIIIFFFSIWKVKIYLNFSNGNMIKLR